MRNRQRKIELGNTLSILLVGEHQVILRAMKNWLAPLGHRLTWVKNGLEAINQLRQQHFDMVVTELAMPGLDGSLVAQFLQNSNDHATLVGLSPGWDRDLHDDLVTDGQAELHYVPDSATCAGGGNRQNRAGEVWRTRHQQGGTPCADRLRR